VQQLSSGLTTICQPILASPVVVMDVWVQAGAMIEPEPWAGMAHFLEHMIFKGTQRIAPGEFDRAVESRGGTTNAATSYDYAHYYIVTAAELAADTLPYLAELLLNAAIPDHEFDRERDVVLEELHQALDNPDWLGFQALLELVYPGHPYGRSVLGSEAALMARSPDDMRCFHACHYQPHNMSVAVVGGLSQDQSLEIVERAFAGFAPPRHCPQSPPAALKPLRGVVRQDLVLPRLEHARLTIAWSLPGAIASRTDLYCLELISAILTEGRSSRLVRELREERQWVQAIGCDCTVQREASLFLISAWLEPQWLTAVETTLLERIAEVRDRPVTDTELARAQRMLANDYAFSTETPSQLAGLYGYYQMMGNLADAVRYPRAITACTAADIQATARRYLSPEHYAVVTLRPE
jgi:predicted Zn-dependent peptidase